MRIDEILCKKQLDVEIFLDDVHSSQNNSAILRSCDAVGVLNVYYASRNNQDIKIHKTITQGSHRWVSRERIEYTQRVSFTENKKAQGKQVIVTAPDKQAISFRKVDFCKPTLLIVGNEKNGVSPEILALADERVSIPMMGMAQSLNVSVATAIILYEIQRQREEASMYTKPQLSKKERDKIKNIWLYRDSIARRSKGEISVSQKPWLDW